MSVWSRLQSKSRFIVERQTTKIQSAINLPNNSFAKDTFLIT